MFQNHNDIGHDPDNNVIIYAIGIAVADREEGQLFSWRLAQNEVLTRSPTVGGHVEMLANLD